MVLMPFSILVDLTWNDSDISFQSFRGLIKVTTVDTIM